MEEEEKGLLTIGDFFKVIFNVGFLSLLNKETHS